MKLVEFHGLRLPKQVGRTGEARRQLAGGDGGHAQIVLRLAQRVAIAAVPF